MCTRTPPLANAHDKYSSHSSQGGIGQAVSTHTTELLCAVNRLCALCNCHTGNSNSNSNQSLLLLRGMGAVQALFSALLPAAAVISNGQYQNTHPDHHNYSSNSGLNSTGNTQSGNVAAPAAGLYRQLSSSDCDNNNSSNSSMSNSMSHGSTALCAAVLSGLSALLQGASASECLQW